jgi:hypothetical protein
VVRQLVADLAWNIFDDMAGPVDKKYASTTSSSAPGVSNQEQTIYHSLRLI